MTERVVIVGAGQAAAQAVASLRSGGFGGAITLVGEETYIPYQRPPLSKAYLMGTLERERLFLKPSQFYAEANCELVLGVSATGLDRNKRVVVLGDGRVLTYDKLLIATGSRVRRLGCEGADLPGVHYLRSIDDVDRLRAGFSSGKRLAVVGGGYIGLEVAAVARKSGLEVAVFEFLDRLMARAVSPVISAFYEKVHREAGVKFLKETAVDGFEGNGRLEAIRAGSTRYPADIALVGIGIVPNQELAANAGLSCEDGIVVRDNCSSTDDDDVFAAGDCTRHIGLEGTPVRLESVQNAIDQAKHAALGMLGTPKPYREVPWFWSDQYELKLQIAGLAHPEDEIVVRGEPDSRKFAVFHLRNGTVKAVEAVNAAPEYLIGRKLIAERAKVAPHRLADTAILMKNIA
ncbi:MAG: FAD-dependent oxidoreductase [Alphaproteobacteria bacterium]|nr:FAD-dependent oxidoreductase [Alphaproteobacteria bacterium]